MRTSLEPTRKRCPMDGTQLNRARKQVLMRTSLEPTRNTRPEGRSIGACLATTPTAVRVTALTPSAPQRPVIPPKFNTTTSIRQRDPAITPSGRMSRDARRSYDGVVPRYTPNHARAATDTASQQPTKAPSTGFKCASNARSRRKTARQEALTSSHRAIVLPTHHPRHPRAHGFVQTHAHFQKTQKNTENTATQRVVSPQPPLVPARGLATCQQRGLDPRDHPRLPAAAHPRYAVHRPNSISHDHGTAGWVAARCHSSGITAGCTTPNRSLPPTAPTPLTAPPSSEAVVMSRSLSCPQECAYTPSGPQQPRRSTELGIAGHWGESRRFSDALEAAGAAPGPPPAPQAPVSPCRHNVCPSHRVKHIVQRSMSGLPKRRLSR